MTKVVISKSFGSGFGPTNKTVYDWLNQHGGENLVKELKTVFLGNCYQFAHEGLRYNNLVIQCIEELGYEQTGYRVEEYDEMYYDVEIDNYDGKEWIDLVPILDVELMTEMSAEDLAAYLDEKGIKHNYGR